MTWFRFYTDTIQDRKIRRLSLAHRWLWVTVLSLAKESPVQGELLLSRNVSVTFHDISDAANISVDDVESGMQRFEELDMLHRDEEDGHYIVTHWGKRQFVSDDATSRVQKYREKQRENVEETLPVTETKRFKDVTSNNIATPHITETEKEIKRDVHPDRYTPEFESFWNKYPNKKGKKSAFDCWNKLLKKGVQSTDLEKAAQFYAEECRREKTTPKYILHGTTFLGQSRRYEDYLDQQVDEPESPKQYYRASAEESEEAGSVFDLLTGQSG